MSEKKLQIWLRRDQAECVVGALDYLLARFSEHGSKELQQPAVKCACEMAADRVAIVRSIFQSALTSSHEDRT